MRDSFFSGSGQRVLCTVIISLLFATLYGTTTAQAQTATNYAAVDTVQVGDTFNYSIVVEYPSSYNQINFPDSSHFGSPVSIVNRKRYKRGERADSLSYTLQFFGTQSYTIPKLPVHFITDSDTTTIYVPPVPLDFKTILQAENDSLLPLKPIFNFALNWWPYVIGLLVLFVAGYLLYKWYQKRKSAKQKKEAPPFTPQPFMDPLEELEKNLQEIRQNSDLQDHEAFKAFYSKLGDALRWYLERVYEIPALESTTRELLGDLKREDAPEPLIHKTKTILKEADMVKFARFNPTGDQASQALTEANTFLEIAKHKDRRRIEFLRNQHEEKQQQLKKEYLINTKETEINNYD